MISPCFGQDEVSESQRARQSRPHCCCSCALSGTRSLVCRPPGPARCGSRLAWPPLCLCTLRTGMPRAVARPTPHAPRHSNTPSPRALAPSAQPYAARSYLNPSPTSSGARSDGREACPNRAAIRTCSARTYSRTKARGGQTCRRGGPCSSARRQSLPVSDEFPAPVGTSAQSRGHTGVGTCPH